MRLAFILLLACSAACSRNVVVESAPSTASTATLKVNNTTSQAVSIYVTASGPELFLKSVPANSTEVISVTGVPAGSTVRLRATLADGSRSYTRDAVVLSGVFEWNVP